MSKIKFFKTVILFIVLIQNLLKFFFQRGGRRNFVLDDFVPYTVFVACAPYCVHHPRRSLYTLSYPSHIIIIITSCPSPILLRT